MATEEISDGPSGQGFLRYGYTSEQEEEVQKRFEYHAPKGDQAKKYAYIRFLARELARELYTLCPSSREFSLALTKLEETIMWANASIARNE